MDEGTESSPCPCLNRRVPSRGRYTRLQAERRRSAPALTPLGVRKHEIFRVITFANYLEYASNSAYTFAAVRLELRSRFRVDLCHDGQDFSNIVATTTHITWPKLLHAYRARDAAVRTAATSPASPPSPPVYGTDFSKL